MLAAEAIKAVDDALVSQGNASGVGDGDGDDVAVACIEFLPPKAGKVLPTPFVG